MQVPRYLVGHLIGLAVECRFQCPHGRTSGLARCGKCGRRCRRTAWRETSMQQVLHAAPLKDLTLQPWKAHRLVEKVIASSGEGFHPIRA